MRRGIYRCGNGHLFMRGAWAMLREANLGPGRHFEVCPVDGSRGVVTRVSRSELTADEIETARATLKR